MPTAKDRLLEMSSLSNVAARLHLLNATGGGDITIQVYDQLEIELMAEYTIELDEGVQASIDNDLVIELEPELTLEVS